MRVWGYDKDGNSLYPKSFAGFWIEEDQLVIGITEYTDEELTKDLKAISSPYFTRVPVPKNQRDF